MTFYYSTDTPDFKIRFKFGFSSMLRHKRPIFLCIGTDKVPGDSLGPCTGSLLSGYGAKVYGTIGRTVNATNLTENIARIHRENKDPFIIAIDASLGTKEHIGFITLSNTALHAGAGVCKRLIPVGNIAITGIVTEYGQNGFHRLMNVSYEKVEKMSLKLADALMHF